MDRDRKIDRKWIYIFLSQKNKHLSSTVKVVVFVSIILIGFILSILYIQEEKTLSKVRLEKDPRKTININYESIKKIERSEMNPENLYIYDGAFVHRRSERDLSYKTFYELDSFIDFAVNKKNSVILTRNNDVIFSDADFKDKNPVMLMRETGPDKLTNQITEYGSYIYIFADNKLYRYHKQLNYWENVSKKLNIPDAKNAYFNGNFIVLIKERSVYLVYPNEEKVEKTLFSNKVDDVAFSNDNIYIKAGNKIYTLLPEPKIVFSSTSFIGKETLGLRLVSDKIFLLTDRAINIYDIKTRTWHGKTLENRPIEFFVLPSANQVVVVFENRIEIYSVSKTINKIFEDNYDKLFNFNGEQFYYFKDNKIYTKGKEVFSLPGTKWENFDATKVFDVYHYAKNLFFFTNSQIYVYNLGTKKYTSIIGEFKKITPYEKNIYYLKNNDLYVLNAENGKEDLISKSVIDFDVTDDNIAYITSDGTLFCNGTEYFSKDMNLNLNEAAYIQKIGNNIAILAQNQLYFFDLNTYKLNKQTIKGNLITVKKYPDSNFAIITTDEIYFVSSEGKISKTLPNNREIISTRGDYIIRTYENGDKMIYELLESNGNLVEIPVQKPFSNVDIRRFFAIDNKILFHLKNGDVYLLDPFNYSYTKPEISYANDIENVQKINGIYYCMSDNTLYELLTKKVVEKDVKDYTFFNEQLVILKPSYIKIDKSIYFNGKLDEIANGNYLLSTFSNPNLIVVTDQGVMNINIETMNIKTKKLKIQNAIKKSSDEIFLLNEGTLYLFNTKTFETRKYLETNGKVMVDNGNIYIKEGNTIKKFESGRFKELYKFSTINSNEIFTDVYYLNGYLYCFNNSSYAIYDTNKLSWIDYKKAAISKVTYIDSKLWVVLNGSLGYFDGTKFVPDDSLEDFKTFNSFKGFFKSLNEDISNILAAISDNRQLVILTSKGSVLKFDISTLSWEKLDELTGIQRIFKTSQEIIVVGTDYIARYDITGQKSSIDVQYDSMNYGDYIILKNANNYFVYDKKLNKIFEQTIQTKITPPLIDAYVINNTPYFVTQDKELLITNQSGEIKQRVPIKKYIYTGSDLIFLSNGNLISAKNSQTIEKAIYDFAIFNDKSITLSEDGIKYEKTKYNYKLDGEVLYIYPTSNEFIVVTEKNIYSYNLSDRTAKQIHRIESPIQKISVAYSKDSKYILMTTSQENILLNISTKELTKIRKSNDMYRYRNKVYIPEGEILYIYDEKRETQSSIISDLNNIISSITNVYYLDKEFYIRTKDAMYKLTFKDGKYSLSKENKKIAKYSAINNSEITVVGSEIYYNGNKLSETKVENVQKIKNLDLKEATEVINNKPQRVLTLSRDKDKLKIQNIYKIKENTLIFKTDKGYKLFDGQKLTDLTLKKFGAINLTHKGAIYLPDQKEVGIYVNNVKIRELRINDVLVDSKESVILFSSPLYVYLNGEFSTSVVAESVKIIQKNEYYIPEIINGKLTIKTTQQVDPYMEKLKTVNGKFWFDDIRKVGINYSGGSFQYYGYIPEVGLVNIETGKYLTFNQEIKNITCDSQGRIVLIAPSQFYTISDNAIKPINSSEVMVTKQLIEITPKGLISKDVTVSITSHPKVKIFDNLYSISEFFTNHPYATASEFTTDGGSLILKKGNYIYRYNSPFEIELIAKNNLNSLNYVDGKLTSAALNNQTFNTPIKMNILPDISEIKVSESKNNIVMYEGKSLTTAISEKIRLITKRSNINYVVTEKRLYVFLSDLKVLKTFSTVLKANSLLNYIYIQTPEEQILYNPATESFENYKGEIIGVDLDSKEMKLANYRIKFANSYYSPSQISMKKELYGLLKIGDTEILNENLYISAENGWLFMMYKNIANLYLISKSINANKLRNIDGNLIIDGKYKIEGTEIKKLNGRYTEHLLDINYDGKNLSTVKSNDEKFDVFYNGKSSKFSKVLFNTIFGITSTQTELILLTDNGIYEYENKQTRLIETNQVTNYKKILGRTFYTADKNYEFIPNDKKSVESTKLSISTLIDINNKKITNKLTKTPEILITDSKKTVNITNNITDLKPINRDTLYTMQGNNLIIISSNLRILQISEPIEKLFVSKSNIVIKTNKGEYTITDSGLEKYDNKWEFSKQAIELSDKTVKETTEHSITLLGKKIENISQLKPNAVYIQKEVIYENQLGLYTYDLSKEIASTKIVDKKRINDTLYLLTENSKNSENSLKPFYTIIIKNGNIQSKISGKYHFSIDGISFEKLIIDGKFIFDKRPQNIYLQNNNLYVEVMDTIWKFNNVPKLISRGSLSDVKITKEEKLEKISENDTDISKSRFVRITIDERYKPEAKLYLAKPEITDNQGKSLIKNNRFIFDIIDNILYTDKLYIINSDGIFSKNYMTKIEAQKEILSTTQYLRTNKKVLNINKDKLSEIQEPKFTYKDNKWAWIITKENLTFQNLFNAELKRTYDKNLFKDDIPTNVDIKEQILVKTSDNILTYYDTKKLQPINMKKFNGESLDDLPELTENSVMTIQTNKYRYTITRKNKYIILEKNSGGKKKDG